MKNVHVTSLNRMSQAEAQMLEPIDNQIVYGEPPPSYVMAKYYPKASKTCTGTGNTESLLVCVSQSTATSAQRLGTERCAVDDEEDNVDDEKTSHIYENIDELTGQVVTRTSTRRRDRDQTGKRRRNRFSALKKVNMPILSLFNRLEQRFYLNV